MRGFTGEYYNGVPIFIRNEYEKENAGRSETERLGDMLGASYDTLFGAMSKAEIVNEKLLYNTGDVGRDLRLQRGSTHLEMWRPYKNGYVHEITGEYIVSAVKPSFESFPAWRYMPIGYGNSFSEYDNNHSWQEWLAAAALFVSLFGL